MEGIRYPGEAVFTESWDPRWGGPPGIGAMFRVVFLAAPAGSVSADAGNGMVKNGCPSIAQSSPIQLYER